ncbi:MAG: diguanylate cyclase [Thermoguttaceae bacterium]
MAEFSTESVEHQYGEALSPAPVPVGTRIAQIGSLLEELQRPASQGGIVPPVFGPQVDNELVVVRLGIAASLYTAIRCRSAAFGRHVLRVALDSSSWATRMGVSGHGRDAIEVAALLHDLGVIGMPDQVLLKAGPLNADDSLRIEQSRRMTLEILRSACGEPEVLQIVEHVPAWYDGSRGGCSAIGRKIPLGARMIHVVEAYDSMTTDQIFRRALSEERAMRELYGNSGTQFDPELVHDFAEFRRDDPARARLESAGRWLQTLDPETANSGWHWNSAAPAERSARELPFEEKLLDSMHDAVLFVDAGLRIVGWNHAAERLTGIAADSVCRHPWSPSLLNMQDEKGAWIAEDDCPVVSAVRTGTQSLRRLTICGPIGRLISVDSHAIPVMADDGAVCGAAIVLHDASSEISLEERCQTLHERATKDPLTQVANRAEFDRVHELFVHAHREQRVPCSLIICDLDRFKLVNDTFGHQAGDEAIKALANILRNACRSGDLVARYGGEEFVMLSANCDIAQATRRAEHVRQMLAQFAVPGLKRKRITASFGVTEVQPGDTPETMLRRADRALFTAKERGRNRVVQLGSGAENGGLAFWRRRSDGTPLVVQQDVVTPIPAAMAIEKLRGFVADHRAQILKIDGDRIELQIDDDRAGPTRRTADRPVGFCIDLRFEERPAAEAEAGEPGAVPRWRTRVHIAIVPHTGGDRRQGDVAERAREVLASFRSYLMATVEPSNSSGGALDRVKRWFGSTARS